MNISWDLHYLYIWANHHRMVKGILRPVIPVNLAEINYGWSVRKLTVWCVTCCPLSTEAFNNPYEPLPCWIVLEKNIRNIYIYLYLLSQYADVIFSAMASQITSLTIVYSTVYSGAEQRKYQSSASLAFVRGIHRWPVNSPHKGPVTRKMFPFDNVTDMVLLRTIIHPSIPMHPLAFSSHDIELILPEYSYFSAIGGRSNCCICCTQT